MKTIDNDTYFKLFVWSRDSFKGSPVYLIC